MSGKEEKRKAHRAELVAGSRGPKKGIRFLSYLQLSVQNGIQETFEQDNPQIPETMGRDRPWANPRRHIYMQPDKDELWNVLMGKQDVGIASTYDAGDRKDSCTHS